MRPLPLGGFWRLLGVHHLGAGGGVCLSLRHGGGPQDIQSVTLLEALPEDDYVRTNGLDDGRRLIGHFRGRETGPCEMYLYTAASPLLAVETGEGTLYFNSQDPAQTQTWYADLLAVTAGM